MDTKKVFIDAIPILQQIEDAGFEAYFVGGSVRDFLLQRSIHDVDIATSATPYEIKAIFPKTVDVGIEHGTVLVLYKGTGFEVTTFRTESDYVDYRRPEKVAFIRSLEEDLKRRDFTMNAIAMDRHFQIIDPFGGIKSIEKKVIETVGNAEERFNEDALRLMRALRFMSQLGFTLHNETIIALCKHAHLLEKIAIERVLAEMEKFLGGKYKKVALQQMIRTELYQYFPSIFNDLRVIEECIALNSENLNELEMWLLATYLNRTKNPKDDLKTWKLPNKKIKAILFALTFLQSRMEKEWDDFSLYQAGGEVIEAVERVYNNLHNKDIMTGIKELEDRYKNLPIRSRQEIIVTGNDVLQWVQKQPGPWMKTLLTEIEQAIVNRQVPNDTDAIRKWVKSWQILENN